MIVTTDEKGEVVCKRIEALMVKSRVGLLLGVIVFVIIEVLTDPEPQ